MIQAGKNLEPIFSALLRANTTWITPIHPGGPGPRSPLQLPTPITTPRSTGQAPRTSPVRYVDCISSTRRQRPNDPGGQRSQRKRGTRCIACLRDPGMAEFWSWGCHANSRCASHINIHPISTVNLIWTINLLTVYWNMQLHLRPNMDMSGKCSCSNLT